MNHNHTKCSHVLKFCEQCDVVHCSMCFKEWKQQYGSNLTWSGGSGGTGIGNGMTLPFVGDNITLCSGTNYPNHTH